MEYGGNLMIRSIFTNGFLAAIPPLHYPKCSKTDRLEVSTSNAQDPRDPKIRSTFVLERAYDSNMPDKIIRFGEKFHISIQLPGLLEKCYLVSEPNNLTNQRWGPNTQVVYLSFEKSPQSLWKFEWPDSEYRLENEFRPVEAGNLGILVHVHTGAWLSASNGPQTQIPYFFLM
jgi:hypothetical protein